ncbi:MAG: hypothetical protein COB08_010795 [Rhodobacteraceae bacterium]|nr:hypothetical protein [Paracoccaceae bacterium]
MSPLADNSNLRPSWQGALRHATEIAVRPASMGIALVAQAYLLQKTAEGFLAFNAIYATQNILAHLFYPGIAISAFRAANGFSQIQLRLFYLVSTALVVLAFALLPFWSAATIALVGTALTATRSIMAQYYLGQARPIISSMLTQILPWSTLMIFLVMLPNTDYLPLMPLLMVLPSGLLAIKAIFGLAPNLLSSSLKVNWKLGVFAFIQSFKNHGISILASSFPSAEVAGALFMVKLLSAAQNVVEYAGARRVKRLSVLLRARDEPAPTGALKSAMRDGLGMGVVMIAGTLLLYFQPFLSGFEALEALKASIMPIIILLAVFSPFFLMQQVAVNILEDGQLFAINVTSVAILLGVYAAGHALMAPGLTIFLSYAAATLYFASALTYGLTQCQK